jgi:cell division protease FtsH
VVVVIFGDVSTGARDDLQKATDLARHMITQYGMSDRLGLATYEAPRSPLFLRVDAGVEREYSEDTARAIDAEIRVLLEAAHGRVRDTLTARRGVLEALAKLLIETEVVDRKRLDELLARPRAPRAPGEAVNEA